MVISSVDQEESVMACPVCKKHLVVVAERFDVDPARLVTE